MLDCNNHMYVRYFIIVSMTKTFVSQFYGKIVHSEIYIYMYCLCNTEISEAICLILVYQ